MLDQRQIDSLKRILKDSDDVIFVVEGKRDRGALRKLGIEHIVAISGGNLEEVTESMENAKRVAILTDFDREGKRKAREIERVLQSYGVKIERRTRSFFNKVLKVTQIEELDAAAEAIDDAACVKELNRKNYRAKKSL